jgi:hypothetical protein
VVGVSVYASVLAEVKSWQIEDSSEGQRALVLAAALDDRAGVQNIAATDKRLGDLMADLRERYEPKKKGRLELLRGGSEQTG